MARKRNNTVALFLDSGAFSAWSMGSTIDLDEYIAFIHANEHRLEIYACLDVIGDPEATWRNQRIMEEAGLAPMPVYHSEDHIRYLHRCLDNYEFFAIGGMAKGFTQRERQLFLDKSWDVVCRTKDRMPRARIHGFGMTSFKLMRRYPWYSVDSTSWVLTSRMGSVLIPMPDHNGGWLYNIDPMKVTFSSKSPSVKDKGKHFHTLPITTQKLVLRYLDEQGYPLGRSEPFTAAKGYVLAENESWIDKDSRKAERILEPGVCNNYSMRDQLNILYFKAFEQAQPVYPWPFQLKGGFSLG